MKWTKGRSPFHLDSHLNIVEIFLKNNKKTTFAVFSEVAYRKMIRPPHQNTFSAEKLLKQKGAYYIGKQTLHCLQKVRWFSKDF